MDWLMKSIGSVVGRVADGATFKTSIPAPEGKPMNLSGAEKPSTKLIQKEEITLPQETIPVSTTAATSGHPKLLRIQPLRIKVPETTNDKEESIF
jgi:hypothetical protein